MNSGTFPGYSPQQLEEIIAEVSHASYTRQFSEASGKPPESIPKEITQYDRDRARHLHEALDLLGYYSDDPLAPIRQMSRAQLKATLAEVIHESWRIDKAADEKKKGGKKTRPTDWPAEITNHDNERAEDLLLKLEELELYPCTI